MVRVKLPTGAENRNQTNQGGSVDLGKEYLIISAFESAVGNV